MGEFRFVAAFIEVGSPIESWPYRFPIIVLEQHQGDPVPDRPEVGPVRSVDQPVDRSDDPEPGQVLGREALPFVSSLSESGQQGPGGVGLEVDVAESFFGKGVDEELDAAVGVDGVLESHMTDSDPFLESLKMNIEIMFGESGTGLDSGFVTVVEPKVVFDDQGRDEFPTNSFISEIEIFVETQDFIFRVHSSPSEVGRRLNQLLDGRKDGQLGMGFGFLRFGERPGHLIHPDLVGLLPGQDQVEGFDPDFGG